MATCQITVTDEGSNLTVEMISNQINDKESKANLFTSWLAANWDELVLLFRAQLTAAHQEATGEQPVTQPSAPILGPDGKPAHAELFTPEQAAAGG